MNTTQHDNCESNRELFDLKDVIFLGVAGLAFVVALTSFCYARYVVKRYTACTQRSAALRGVISGLAESDKSFTNPSFTPIEGDEWKALYEDEESHAAPAEVLNNYQETDTVHHEAANGDLYEIPLDPQSESNV